jgi:hypothetical protein
MKKKLVFPAFLLLALSLYGQSNSSSLNTAIHNAALQIQEGLEKNSTIVVYQFESQNSQLSDYILKELFDRLVNSRQFIVLDRTAQEVVDAEIDFQFTRSAGMISDDSLANLTQRIGAGAIVTGSLDDAANEYRFRIRVIGTETTAAIVSYVASIDKNDRQVNAFSRQQLTSNQKLIIGVQNLLFGLGSWLNGDIAGGITVTGAYVVAAGLMVVEAAALDRDSPAAGVPATIGISMAGLTMIYGFVRPFIYNRSPQAASVLDNTRPRIDIVSGSYGENSIPSVQLSWSIQF